MKDAVRTGNLVQTEKLRLSCPNPSLTFLRAHERNTVDTAYKRYHDDQISTVLANNWSIKGITFFLRIKVGKKYFRWFSAQFRQLQCRISRQPESRSRISWLFYKHFWGSENHIGLAYPWSPTRHLLDKGM